MGKKKKKSEEIIPLLTVRGMRKFLFGSRSRGGVTLVMICGAIIGISKAAPIAWGWTMQSRAIAENVLTQDLQKKVTQVQKNVAVIQRDVKQIDHNHSTRMNSMMREMQIQREMGHRSWALLRDMAGIPGPPPDPETLVPTMVPTASPISLAERKTLE